MFRSSSYKDTTIVSLQPGAGSPQQRQQWMVEFSSWLVSSTTFVENQLTNWKPTNFAISTVILQYNKVDFRNSCLKRLSVKLFPSKSVTVSLWHNHGPHVVCIDIICCYKEFSIGWVDETSGALITIRLPLALKSLFWSRDGQLISYQYPDPIPESFQGHTISWATVFFFSGDQVS